MPKKTLIEEFEENAERIMNEERRQWEQEPKRFDPQKGEYVEEVIADPETPDQP